MKIIRTSILLLAGLALCACSYGSGRVETSQVDVAGVRRVQFEGVGDLRITQGERESLTIEAESEALKRISSEVRGDTLVIRLERRFWEQLTIPTEEIRFDLTVRDLESVTLAGAGDVHLAGLETDALDITLSGAGQLNATDLNVRQLNTRLSGAGSATVAGVTEVQDALVSGAGSYEADDLASQTATIAITGAGDATVWVTQRLEAKIQGVGSIRYYGDPRLDQQINGVGQVKSLGER